MTIILMLVVSLAVLLGGGYFYSRYLARCVGEDNRRVTPAVRLADGRDYVPSPTWVVFAHHFAAIAGAGPIVGPVLALVYGWGPALLWVVLGGLFLGGVHDYLATHMATREGGVSVATILRRLFGHRAFVAMTLFLIVMLVLVCAVFLNLSANALSSKLPAGMLEMPPGQTLFRTVSEGGKDFVVIGGVASMSVVIITAFAPLVGWMYIKKKVSVVWCSALSVAICAVSIVAGIYFPLSFSDIMTWKLLLLAYVLVAAGVPVWLFLQSRDFINCHILYVGMGALLVTLLVAAGKAVPAGEAIAPLQWNDGYKASGFIWPGLFITVACGAISGFHSLCAGGTTCKQVRSEKAVRRIGYYAMLLESLVAVVVIAVMVLAVRKGAYLPIVYPKVVGLAGDGNPILGFALAVGYAGKLAWGAPVAVGALGGMLLLEGFVITTLDAAVRLTRYLIEEIWRAAFARYDVFAQPVGQAQPECYGQGELTSVGGEGIPISPEIDDQPPAPKNPLRAGPILAPVLRLMRHYWFNSGLAVLLTLLLACTGGVNVLWRIFATANQLLAGMVLALAGVWLLRQKRKSWFAFAPAVFMLATTATSLAILLRGYLNSLWSAYQTGTDQFWPSLTLTLADLVLMALTAYLLVVGVMTAWRWRATADRQFQIIRRRDAEAQRKNWRNKD